jgi:uncharacterized delta-60 repeat protein
MSFPSFPIARLKNPFLLFAACFLLTGALIRAAMAVDPGSVDASFNPTVTDPGAVPNAIVVQPDGKIIVGGVFPFVGGVEHSCIVRLNADGSTDTSFNAQADAEVSALALQSDGKILLGGYFGKVNGTARAGIARLNADGTLDATFDPGSGAGTSNAFFAGSIAVKAIGVQGDGKIVIGGTFDQFNGVTHSGLARLNSDGSLDSSFAPVVTEIYQVTVRAVVIQPNGKIVFGGGFETVNGSAFTNLARLNSDGTLDPAFVSQGPSGGFNPENVTSIALQSDGKIVVCGAFVDANGTTRKSVARFNSDGSLDPAFNPGAKITYDVFGANDVVIQGDGKIIISGGFSTKPEGRFQQNSIIRVNSDGSLDNTFVGTTSRGIFDGDEGDSLQVSAVAVLPSGKIIIAGDFSLVDGVKEASCARLNADGSLDSGFQTQFQSQSSVFDLAVQDDDKIVIGGGFHTVNGTSIYSLARLNADGTLDSTFTPDFQLGPAANVDVTVFLELQHLAVQNDGKVLYSAFKLVRTSPNTDVVTSNPFGRLNADGSMDSTFNVTFDSPSAFLSNIVPQPDGRILIAGNFSKVDGVARASFARINADGSLDTNFQPPALLGVGPSGTPATAQISKIVVQPDGKILLGGTFALTDTTKPVDVIRLNSDGSLDSTFHAALPLVEDMNFQQPSVLDIALQSDGKILVAGEFSLATANQGGDFARLNSDGSLDNSFNGLRGVERILPQPDGKILVGGNFAQLNGVADSGLARVNSDGSIDTSFTVTITDRSRYAVVPNFVFAFGLQADGKIVVGGTFDMVNGATHTALVRLEGDSGSRLLNISTRLAVGTGENVLIGGFIITGTDPKTVIIRGIGPSLPGVGGTLADPTLELHQGATTLATNDNWKINDSTGQSQEAAIRATTIPPANDLESAILATLNPGPYTAILAGKNGTTGVGLVEVYDLAQGANAQLANISTRSLVQTGDNVMIGGFIVGNGTANVGGIAKVIVRALGPSLGASGIGNTLADPTLELHDGNGNTIATNDNWKASSNGSSQQSEIEATTIPPPNDLESALVATLGPGNYTAIVRGKNNSTGVGLVEVYNLP